MEYIQTFPFFLFCTLYAKRLMAVPVLCKAFPVCRAGSADVGKSGVFNISGPETIDKPQTLCNCTPGILKGGKKYWAERTVRVHWALDALRAQ